MGGMSAVDVAMERQVQARMATLNVEEAQRIMEAQQNRDDHLASCSTCAEVKRDDAEVVDRWLELDAAERVLVRDLRR